MMKLADTPTAGSSLLADAIGDEGWPGAQGSPACCTVLKALYLAAPTGLTREDLQAYTALDEETFNAAMKGLRERRRIERVTIDRRIFFRVALPSGHLPSAEARLQQAHA